MRTGSLRLAHPYRWHVLATTVVSLLFFLWLLASEMVKNTPAGSRIIDQVERFLGVSIAADMGLQGTLGVWTSNQPVYLVMLAGTFALWAATQAVALQPGRHWMRRGLQRRPLPAAATACHAGVASLVTTAAVASLMDFPLRLWWALRAPAWDVPGIPGTQVNPQSILAAGLLVAGWGFWWWLLRRGPAVRDRFMQSVHLCYYLFVAAGLVMLGSGLSHLFVTGVGEPGFYMAGDYTGMVLSLAALLWTAVPGVVFVFTSQIYQRRRMGWCVGCGYDLQGSDTSPGTACPECGGVGRRRFVRPAAVRGAAAHGRSPARSP